MAHGGTLRFIPARSTTFACPFCGREVEAGHTSDGQQAVAHPLPMCQEYATLAPGEYLAACNRARAN
jgi:hypothetical protein